MSVIFIDTYGSGRPMVTAYGTPIVTSEGAPVVTDNISRKVPYMAGLGYVYAMACNRRRYAIVNPESDDSFTVYADELDASSVYASENRLIINVSHRLTYVDDPEINEINLSGILRYISRRVPTEIKKKFDIASWLSGSRLSLYKETLQQPSGLETRSGIHHGLSNGACTVEVSTSLTRGGYRPSTSYSYWSAGGIIPLAFHTARPGWEIRVRAPFYCYDFESSFPLTVSAGSARVYPITGTWTNDTAIFTPLGVGTPYYVATYTTVTQESLGDEPFTEVEFDVTVPPSRIILMDFGDAAHTAGYSIATALRDALASSSSVHAHHARISFGLDLLRATATHIQ